jgi:putative aldouronate transport system substrate-binding protein
MNIRYWILHIFLKEKTMKERRTKTVFAVLLVILVMAVPSVYAGGTRQEQRNQSPVINGLREVVLKLYLPGEPTPWDEAVWRNVENMSKNALNAKFDVVHIPFADYSDKMQLLAASGDNFDLYFDATWLVFPTMLKNGAIMELDDLMDRYAPTLKADLERTGSLVWAKINGKIMAIPADNPSSRYYLQIREDLRAKYNVSGPFTTIEDEERYLEAVMAGESNIRAVNNVIGSIMWDNALGATAQEYELDIAFGVGNFDFTYNIRDPKVTIIPLERTEAFRKASRIRARWYERGWIPRNAMNETESNYSTLDQGKYAAVMRSAFDSYQEMRGPGEKGVYLMYPDKMTVTGTSMANAFCINRNAANPERAMMFMEWANASQANYDAILYGIKDTTYVVDNGIIRFPPGQDAQSGYLEWSGHWAFWRSRWRQPSWEFNQEVREALQAELEMPNIIPSPTAGFTFDTDPVKTAVANRQAVIDQYGKILQFGLRSDVDAAVDEYIQRLNAAGTNEILAELQKQVDAFLAQK